MRKVTLKAIYQHPITQKYVRRSGMAHAISVAYHAFGLAKEYDVNPDWASKAGFLHDIGHYEWYSDGEWDYQLYRNYDIHPIKGAERAHKLLVRLGEDKLAAKEISHAILFHTDSALPSGNYELSPLQKVVHLADEKDKQPDNLHHYRNIDSLKELLLIEELDKKIELILSEE
ncbi:HD domain-containing protein [Ornithinibacillus sp. L9]|uniref:HD domain-containing protein n=1 Tax=Ornithinibacillus caprae TaxID=2678566 RepID=A0A6N8FNW6_9BACI|nr:HD domain-containing protein [Ornithinibacillus caprae]